MRISRALISSGTVISLLSIATNALAQLSSTDSSKGGTSSSLPDAGTTDITYMIFVFGVMLFVFGTIKFVRSWQS